MSDLNVMDYFLSRNSDKTDYKESEMDISTTYENSEFMSSDFFDSILSLEKDNLNDYELDSSLFNLNEINSGATSDGSLTFDDAQCETSTFSDSGLSSDLQEIPDQALSDEEMLKSMILDQPAPVPAVIQQQLKQPTLLSAKPVEYVRPIVIPTTTAHLVSSSTDGPTIKPKFINIIKQNQKTKQVIRVQPLNGNARSVLLPINIKDLKTIKIINPKDLMAENIKLTTTTLKQAKNVINTEKFIMKPTRKYQEVTIEDDDDDDDDDIEIEVQSEHELSQSMIKNEPDDQYPLLLLTPEEKRLLNKDGIQLPCRYPLTKHEERELKRIRRKIRNKISAQDSRKRKKEYVDGLEERVKICSEENRSLLKRIKLLQTQNTKLSSQLSKLQALVFKTGTSRAHPATCLMIVMLSVMLVTLPNLRNLSDSGNKEINTLQQYVARRALLFSQQATNEDTVPLNMDDVTSPLHHDADCAHEQIDLNETVTKSVIPKNLLSVTSSSDQKFKSPPGNYDFGSAINQNKTNRMSFDFGGGGSGRINDLLTPMAGFCPKRYIEPDIDDHWPPEKKLKISEFDDNIEAISATSYWPNRTEYLE